MPAAARPTGRSRCGRCARRGRCPTPGGSSSPTTTAGSSGWPAARTALTPAGLATLAALEAEDAGGRGLEHPGIGQEPGRVDERRVAAQELVVVDDVEARRRGGAGAPGSGPSRQAWTRPPRAARARPGEDRGHGVRAGTDQQPVQRARRGRLLRPPVPERRPGPRRPRRRTGRPLAGPPSRRGRRASTPPVQAASSAASSSGVASRSVERRVDGRQLRRGALQVQADPQRASCRPGRRAGAHAGRSRRTSRAPGRPRTAR